jgi:hypothetical protein
MTGVKQKICHKPADQYGVCSRWIGTQSGSRLDIGAEVRRCRPFNAAGQAASRENPPCEASWAIAQRILIMWGGPRSFLCPSCSSFLFRSQNGQGNVKIPTSEYRGRSRFDIGKGRPAPGNAVDFRDDAHGLPSLGGNAIDFRGVVSGTPLP